MESLLNYGFRNFNMKTLYERDEIVTRVAVKRGQKREIGLAAADPVQAVVPLSGKYKIKEELDLPGTVAAPVKAGDVIGTLRLKAPDGELIAEIQLTAQEDSKRLGFLPHLLRQIGDFFALLWHRLWPF